MVERRLAAILAADVVGYSRLMNRDEAGTLARLQSLLKELVQPKIEKGLGRIVKLMGDGLLAEFPSAVEAVRCAVEIQRDLATSEADAPDDNQIKLRIGVNLGDIIVEGSDIYGDGVNVAARLESLADPGSVCISGKVHEEVRTKVAVVFEDLGEKEIKNIPEPVRVYRWAAAAIGTTPAGAESATSPPLPEKPSIAILPFDNMSGDPEQEFFADGISEDLITALSKIRWFFVIARNSTFTYKGKAVEVTQIARDLGVRYVIEGSVRKSGTRVRITAQLIDATTGRHVWADRYDRDLADIFELQDEMTQTIVGAVEPELSAAERDRAARKPPENLNAWETYQKGLWHLWNFSREDIAEARKLLQRSQDLDPGYATSYAFESYAHYLDAILGFSETPDESLAAALKAAEKALVLDDKDPVAYFALGRVQLLLGEHDASVAELQRSVALNPSFAMAHHGLGFALLLSGRLKEANDELAMALRLSPCDPVSWGTMCYRSVCHNMLQDFAAATEWAQKAVLEPRSAAGGYWPYGALASALANLGRFPDAKDALDEAMKRKPDLSRAYLEKTLPTKQPGGLKLYLDGLTKAGLPA